MADTFFTLNTGAKIPALGMGTYKTEPSVVRKSVAHALAAGYRHIDCAWVYKNEDEVGKGLKDGFDSGVKREDIFVTSKLWCTYLSRAEESLDMSLKSLGLDYIDLYLMHWPVALNPFGNDSKYPTRADGSRDFEESWSHVETWKQMENLLSTGKVKAIGVANYSVRYMEELLKHVSVVPAVNQIENHPWLPQKEIVDLCQSHGIHVTAYSPLGSTGCPLMKEEGVEKVADKYNTTPGAVLLSFHIARGLSVLTKSVNPTRIVENRNLIQLDESDVGALEEISQRKGFRRFVYPAFGVDFGFPDKQ